jgi:hypothetical protein
MQLNFITPRKNNQWLKIAIFFLLLLLISAATFYVLRIYQSYQEMSNIYVDGGYSGRLKWGSQKYPYNNIHEAFQAASLKKTSPISIHLRNGEYIGNIEIPENMKVYGESREGVILKSDNLSSLPIVTMNNNVSIFNVTVLGGRTGILARERAIIENCAVKEFGQIGIDAIISNSEIIVKNSEISDSSGKGFYIQKGRKIQIIGNLVHDNEGEGIDLRQELSGEVRNNDIYKNEESGIELIIGKSSLKIEKNNIWDNGANGIVFQYYDEMPEKGAVLVSNNYIKSISSEEFAISVKSPSGGEGRIKNYWRESTTITDDNVIEGRIKTRSLEITNK